MENEIDLTQASEAGSFQEALEQGIEAQETPEAPAASTPEAKPEIEAGDYKGADRRSKGYDGEKRRAADKAQEDPEHELDFELEPGKGKAKFKTSELKDMASFINKNKASIASTMRLRELGTKHPEFLNLINGVINKSFGEGDAFNSEFVNNTLKALEGKTAAVESEIDDKTDEIKQAEDLLNSDEIDPDSAQARVLRSNIAAMKAQRAQLKTALQKIDEVSKNIDSVQKNQQSFIKNQESAELQSEIKRASDIFNKEYNDFVKNQKYEFVDDEERQEYELKVRKIVENSVDENTNDQSYVTTIHNACKAAYAKVGKLREAYVNDYLKKKGVKPDPEKPERTDEDQLSALEKAGKGETPEAKKLREKIEKTKSDDPTAGKSIGEAIADAMFEQGV